MKIFILIIILCYNIRALSIDYKKYDFLPSELSWRKSNSSNRFILLKEDIVLFGIIMEEYITTSEMKNIIKFSGHARVC
jgi:hypothetical protein